MISLDDWVKSKIQQILEQKVVICQLKAAGLCNNAFYLETENGDKYIVKLGKEHKDFQPQNSLLVEARVAQQLYMLNLLVPIPKVCFVCESPEMYAYDYIEGEKLLAVWPSLTTLERVDICRELGKFHAQIGLSFSESLAQEIGIQIDRSSRLHPEVEKDLVIIMAAANIPAEFLNLATKAQALFDQTSDKSIFHFIHNDAHHENILIQDKKISGIIDFGESMYGEVAREFSRYIRDYPEYWEYIVAAYELSSGNLLSRQRLISNAFLSGLSDIVADFSKGGEARESSLQLFAKYQLLLRDFHQ